MRRGIMMIVGTVVGIAGIAPLAKADRPMERRPLPPPPMERRPEMPRPPLPERPPLREIDRRPPPPPARIFERREQDEHWQRDVRFDGPRYNYSPVIVAADPDFNVAVAFGQVPSAVLNTVNAQTSGAAIQSINYVRSAGSLFYDVQVNRGYGSQTLRVGVDGSFLGYL